MREGGKKKITFANYVKQCIFMVVTVYEGFERHRKRLGREQHTVSVSERVSTSVVLALLESRLFYSWEGTDEH